jgi:hypothetical protein
MPTPDTALIVKDAIGGGGLCMTLMDGRSFNGDQAIPSVTLPEAKEATQRLDSGNIDLVC